MSERRIYYRRGATAGTDSEAPRRGGPPRPRRPTDPDSGEPAAPAAPIRIPVSDTRASNSGHNLSSRTPFTRPDFQGWVRGGGFTSIRVDSGHPNGFSPGSLSSTRFNVLNYAWPSGVDRGDEPNPRAWTVDEFANTISLTESQSRGNRVGYNFEQEVSRLGYTLIRDHAGVPIAIHHENWLAILQDVTDESRNQSRLLTYLIEQFMAVMQAGGRWTPRSLIVNDVDSVKGIFVKLFNSDTQKTQRERDAAESAAASAWRNYTGTLERYEDALRRLERGDRDTYTTESEFVSARAESVLRSLQENPLICGLSMVDNILRVVTKPLPSNPERGSDGSYYSGLRRLVINIPVTFNNSQSDGYGLRIYSLDRDRLRTLPSMDSYFWGDGEFCLGSIKHVINNNILSGDWDMVVMLLLSGVVGRDELRSYTRTYKEAAEAEAEVVAASDAEPHPELEESTEEEEEEPENGI